MIATVRACAVLLLSTALLAAAPAPAVARGLPDFTALVERHRPEVVNISTTRATLAPALPPGGGIPELDGSPFGELLRKFFEQQQPAQPRAEAEPSSLGTGFIISADGYVLTNHHVVDGAEEIIVRLADRRQLNATVVGTDPRSDVAVLKVEATDLPVATVGDSEALAVGEWVLAIGSPFGFDFSVTAGIVSGKGRSLPRENYTPFIQTDVAINPGNSGGPLYALDGSVVGVNSQIYSRNGGYIGLSFAIPIEVAMNVADQLRETGTVKRGWLGVVIQEVTRELAESFGMRSASGALVSQILADSPAAGSSLAVGDVIVAFNGVPVPTNAALPPLVGQVRAGEEAELTVMRAGQRLTVAVTIGELPQPEALARARGGAPSAAADPLGVRVSAPSAAQRAASGVESGAVAVSALDPDGAAAAAGIEIGDLLVRIGQRAVDGVDGYRDVIAALEPGRTVAVLVRRESGPLFLALRLPD